MNRTTILSLAFVLLNCFFCSLSRASDRGDLNIVFLTDIHVTPKAASERALESIIDEVNQGGFDILVLTGDLTNNGSDAELFAVKKHLERLKIPYYVIPGNHETNWSESAGNTFLNLFGNDRFVVSKENYLLVGFSTGPYLKMGDGHVKKEDLFWLEQTLAQEMTGTGKLIIASHYPLKEGLDNWFEVTDRIKPYSPLFTMCGHEHRLSFHNFDGMIGLMGRPAFYKGDTIPGYNIIELKDDSAFVYEKKIGVKEPSLFASFSLNNKDVIRGLPVSHKPDYKVNEIHKNGFKADVVIRDNASIFSGIGLKDSLLFYGNSKGELIAWNYVQNKPVWKNQYKGSLHSTPIVDKENVYVADTGGKMYALDVWTGKEIWSVDLGGPVIGDALLEDDNIYVGAGKCFYKLGTANGQTIWVVEAEGQIQALPTSTKKEIVFGAWDRHLYCVDVITGAINWKWNNNRGGVLLSPGNVTAAISEGKVFIVAPDRYMTAINLATGETVWRTNIHMVRESMGISKDGKAVYAKLMNDSVIAVSTEGAEYKDLWVMDAEFGYDHNPCPLVEHEDILYMGTKNGVLIAIDSRSKKILFRYKCDNSSINRIIPDKTKGGVWITSTEGQVIRVQPNNKYN